MRYRKMAIGVASAVLAVMFILSLLGVALAADPTADASRAIDPQVAAPGEEVEITVTFDSLLAEPRAFGLEEVIPDGWELTRGTDDASAFKPGPPPEWVWFVVEAGATKVVTYTLTVPPDAEAGEYAINGTVLAAEVENPVGGDAAITVEEEAPPVEYDLTISSTAGGEVTEPGEGTFSYGEGTPVGLVATASEGYEFVNWTGDVGTMTNANAAATTITMNDDYGITANFEEEDEYNLTISSTVGGEVTEPGEGTFSYGEGTPVGLVAAASEGYEFVNWTGDVGTVANANAAATTITMNDDYSIAANFRQIGGDGISCGMATLADVIPLTLMSMGVVAVWATKRRGKVS
jgi:hypothetical protein